MARVTVEDCVDKVDNGFELVLLAAQRAMGTIAGLLRPGGGSTDDDEDEDQDG